MIPFLRRSKNLYIHIGLHKTGTTSIQLFMHNNCEIIQKKYGVTYVPVPSDDIAPYQHRYLNKLMISDEDAFLEIFKNNSKSSRNFVVSSECFLEKDEYASQLSKLKNIFKNVYIIIYIRRQDDWIESLYKQVVLYNHKIKHTINEWIELFLSGGYLYYNANFKETIDRWASIFGEENIILRSFDTNQLYNSNVVCDFCNILKITSSKFNNYKIHVNKGVRSREVVEMYRITNGQLSLEKQKEIAGQMIINPSDNLSFMSPEQRKGIMNHFELENNIISKNYNLHNPLFSELVNDNSWKKFEGISNGNRKIINDYCEI